MKHITKNDNLVDAYAKMKQIENPMNKINVDNIIDAVSEKYNMSANEFTYYLMSILVFDSKLIEEFDSLIIAAKLKYSDEAKKYNNQLSINEEFVKVKNRAVASIFTKTLRSFTKPINKNL